MRDQLPILPAARLITALGLTKRTTAFDGRLTLVIADLSHTNVPAVIRWSGVSAPLGV